MLKEGKIKNVLLLAALDISLKRMKKSPERCARNILELGISAYPDRLSEQEKLKYRQMFLSACKQGDENAVRKYFNEAFL